jgi:hypothetical protein
MSRVEDDRQAQRLQERLVQEKRLTEAKAKKTAEGESSFSKLVQQPQTQQKQQPQAKQNLGQAVLARATQEGGGAYGAAMRHAAGKSEERLQQAISGQPTPERQQQVSQESQATVGRREDQNVSETRSESRTSESKKEGEATNERTAESALGRATQHKGALKTDTESGGKGGGGKEKDGKGGEAAAAAGFRFNPALMAPVPVAKPKPTSGSDRLRAIANEIAQKIVERVRVGTNAAGNAEFQIDLRGDVLSGLSIKISAKNGKIAATFSGSDREVLKMLQEQSEGLKSALGNRGLKLEDVRFEART